MAVKTKTQDAHSTQQPLGEGSPQNELSCARVGVGGVGVVVCFAVALLSGLLLLAGGPVLAWLLVLDRRLT